MKEEPATGKPGEKLQKKDEPHGGMTSPQKPQEKGQEKSTPAAAPSPEKQSEKTAPDGEKTGRKADLNEKQRQSFSRDMDNTARKTFDVAEEFKRMIRDVQKITEFMKKLELLKEEINREITEEEEKGEENREITEDGENSEVNGEITENEEKPEENPAEKSAEGKQDKKETIPFGKIPDVVESAGNDILDATDDMLDEMDMESIEKLEVAKDKLLDAQKSNQQMMQQIQQQMQMMMQMMQMMMQMMQEQSSDKPANDPRERRSNQGPAGAPQLQKVPEEKANRNILPPPERSEIMTLRKTPFDLRFSEEVRRYFTKIAQDEKKEKRKMERKTEKKK